MTLYYFFMFHNKFFKEEAVRNFNVISFVKSHFGNYFCLKILNKGNNSHHWHFLINPSFTSLYFLKLCPMLVDFLDNFSERYESKFNNLNLFDLKNTNLVYIIFKWNDFFGTSILKKNKIRPNFLKKAKLGKATQDDWGKWLIL